MKPMDEGLSGDMARLEGRAPPKSPVEEGGAGATSVQQLSAEVWANMSRFARKHYLKDHHKGARK